MSTQNDQQSSAKRSRDSTQDVSNENSPKAPRLSHSDKSFLRELIRESEYITSKVIKQSIKDSEEKHFDYIKNLIIESEQRILSVIENKIDNVKVELNEIMERVNNLEVLSSETVHMKDEILNLKRQLLKQENSVVSSGIRITGIPQYPNEKLLNIFDNICGSLNINTPPVENIYWLKKIYKNNKPYSPNDEVIVVKLHSPFEKNC